MAERSSPKAYLVARREFVENLRTKTFWIGIFSVPVIYVIIIIASVFFAKSKGIRTYMVIDNSGWLAARIEEKASGPDLTLVFEGLRDALKDNDEEALALYPEMLKVDDPRWEFIKEGTPAEIRFAAQQFSLLSKPDGMGSLAALELPPEKLAKIRAVLDAFHGALHRWWKDLSPEDAAKFGSKLSKSRYQKLAIDGKDAPSEKELRKRIEEDKLFAFFVIPKDPVGEIPEESVRPKDNDKDKEKSEKAPFKYVSNNVTDDALKKWFSRLASGIIQEERVKKLDLEGAAARWLGQFISFESKKVGEKGQEENVGMGEKALGFAPVVFVYILWLAIIIMAQMLLTSVVEEKSNRIIEVLLSSISPVQLMTGKIFGLAITGLTVVGFWAVFLFIGVMVLPYVYPEGDSIISKIGLAKILTNPVMVISFFVYFLLGYLFFAAVLCGIGSVCNSLKEAQNLMQPVMVCMIVPILTLMPIYKDPNGTLARVMSYIPIFTPFAMMNRAGGPPPVIDYVLTTILLLASILVAFWAAAKVFRIGVLMTGKPPKLREILRWVRAPVGGSRQS